MKINIYYNNEKRNTWSNKSFKYSFSIFKEVIEEAEEIITLLDENYGANRDVEKDLGGYIALLESKEDVAEIKANSIKKDCCQNIQIL